MFSDFLSLKSGLARKPPFSKAQFVSFYPITNLRLIAQ